MRLLGLSPAWFLSGLLLLAAAVFVLHLLRVRLRPMVVPTLLFYRAAGEVRRPRSLLGRPSRWLAMLLAFLIVAALWLAFAEPLGEDPKRATVIDGRSTLDQQLLDASTGPVWLAGAHPRLLWRPGEPRAFLRLRAKKHQPGHGSALPDALRVAATGRTDVLALGASELPAEWEGAKVRTMAKAQPDEAICLFDIALLDGERRQLWFETNAATVELSCDGASVNHEDGKAVLPEKGKLLRMVLDEVVFEAKLPERREVRVLRRTGLPLAVRLAMATDQRLRIAEGTADIQIARETPLQESLPALLLQDGQGSAPRLPVVTTDCPLPLSLKDRNQKAAPALAPIAGETVWVEDSLSGGPLVAAHEDNGVVRIRIVTWLLEETAHRDVPRLVTGSLQILADLQDSVLTIGRPRLVPAATRLQRRPFDGGFSLASRGRHRLTESAVIPTRGLPPSGAGISGGTILWRLSTWLLLLALGLLLLDVVLYHKGRLP